MAAPAANLQQNLSYWLKREPGAAASERPGWRPPLVTNRSHQFLHNRRLRHKRPRARVRKRHGPPLAADAVAKAAFAPPLPTIKPVTNWPKLGQFPRWIKLGGRPASAISTALRVDASDSPASNAAAASVALLREPRRRPPGLPDRPFSNGRPRTGPDGFGRSTSLIIVSLIRPLGA